MELLRLCVSTFSTDKGSSYIDIAQAVHDKGAKTTEIECLYTGVYHLRG